MASSKASAPQRPKGKETPRLWTRPLRKLTPKTSLGYRAIEFIETVLLITLLPWQKWWLIHAFEVIGPIGDGHLRFRSVLTLVGRQSGKTTLLMCVALWMMYDGRVKLILGAAQSRDIAREAWERAVDVVENDAELSGELATNGVRRTNGEQCLTLSNKAKYRITAANRSAGRGLSVGLLILDELREHRTFEAWAALSKTTSAQPNGLIVAISNAGDDESAVLNQLRERALAMVEDPTTTLAIYEWSAADNCEIDDWDAIAQGTPGLGYTVSYDAIQGSLNTDPAGVFRTEVLCQKVDNLDSTITPMAWEACADPQGSLVGSRRLHFCLDVAPDGAHATLAAAAVTEDGRVRVGIVAAWDRPAGIRDDLPGLLKDHNPKSLSWFPAGPAAAHLADITGLRHVKLVQLTGLQVPAVCQELAEQVSSRQLLHPNDPLLNAHVRGSRKLPSGDGWRFTRYGGHVDAAYAVAGAVHQARIAPRPQKLQLITANIG